MSGRIVLVLSCLWMSTGLIAQVPTLKDFGKNQYNMNRRGLPHGNFSGISMIDDTTFAVVSDKDRKEGFHLWDIRWEEGRPKRVEDRLIESDGESRDAEGIVYHPSTKTVFISAESDQRIKEYNLDGSATGRELKVPEQFGTDRIRPNGGFESLAYDEKNGLFWTCTELPLKGENDGIWLQSFGEDLMPKTKFLYKLDQDDSSKKWRTYLHGIAELCALDDGSLLVLERTVAVRRNYWGSYSETKIYSVSPSAEKEYLEKTLIKSFRTHLNLSNWLGKTRFANYEGMCLGPGISDNERMFIIVNDSQNGSKGLNDYIKIQRYAY